MAGADWIGFSRPVPETHWRVIMVEGLVQGKGFR